MRQLAVILLAALVACGSDTIGLAQMAAAQEDVRPSPDFWAVTGVAP